MTDILPADLAAPGRNLAFCNETDLTAEATSTMVADFYFHAAVLLPSNGYGALPLRSPKRLRRFGVAEFHATAIVNSGKKPAWRVYIVDMRVGGAERGSPH